MCVELGCRRKGFRQRDPPSPSLGQRSNGRRDFYTVGNLKSSGVSCLGMAPIQQMARPLGWKQRPTWELAPDFHLHKVLHAHIPPGGSQVGRLGLGCIYVSEEPEDEGSLGPRSEKTLKTLSSLLRGPVPKFPVCPTCLEPASDDGLQKVRALFSYDFSV